MYVFAKIGHDLKEGLSRSLPDTSEDKQEKIPTRDPISYIPNTEQNVSASDQFIVQNILHYQTDKPINKLTSRLMAINSINSQIVHLAFPVAKRHLPLDGIVGYQVETSVPSVI
jgi:hypothetical protein